MTPVTTGPISRVSCWRRKLWRPFEVQLHRRRFLWHKHFCLTSIRNFGDGGNFKVWGDWGGKKIRSTLIHLRIGISLPILNCRCLTEYTKRILSLYLQN
jgi:hypothetical protein